MRRLIRVETFLARLPLFSGLPEDDIERLAAATTRRSLARGDVLFRFGEPPTGLHALVYGSVKLAAPGPGSGERIVDVVASGSTFGDAIMFLDRPYIVTATALADSLVLHVAKDAIFGGLERNPLFARRIIAGLAQRVEGLVHQLHDYALHSSARRFVAWLLRRPELRGAEGDAMVRLPVTKRALASQLNVSAEHLSRLMHELARDGLVVVQGRDLRVPDVARLRKWQANGPEA